MAKRAVQAGDEIKIARFRDPIPMFVSLVGKPASKHDWVQRSDLDAEGLAELEGGVMFSSRFLDPDVAEAIVAIRNSSPIPASRKAVNVSCPIVRMDVKKRIVYGLAYSPPLEAVDGGEISVEEYNERVDTYGSFMDQETLEELAYAYLEQSRAVDVDHDFKQTGAAVVASYVTDEATEAFPYVGAWVVGIRIYDDDVWARVESGDLAAYSIAVLASFETISVTVRGAGFEERQAADNQTSGTPEGETREEDGLKKKAKKTTREKAPEATAPEAASAESTDASGETPDTREEG